MQLWQGSPLLQALKPGSVDLDCLRGGGAQVADVQQAVARCVRPPSLLEFTQACCGGVGGVQVADMQLKRGAHACATAHGLLFSVGGYDANQFISSGEPRASPRCLSRE
jgi:hypothetical protein